MTNKEAIYIISNRLNTYYCTDEDLQALNLAIKALEERQQGEWIKDGIGGIGSYRCSLCGRVICTSITNNKPYEDYPFCHCGAKMKMKGEAENETD